MAYVRNTIESQLPRHVVQDYPLFVEFLKAYYEWMEENGQPYYALKNHLEWTNFETSIDDYVNFLRKEYLFNLPSDVAGGLELFLSNSKQFHLSVGTERSFKFIFKILFGDEAGDVELYFPRQDILKVSDSDWTRAQNIMYITNSGDSSAFLYRVIKQTREIYPGVFRYAYAIVQKVMDRYAGKYKVSELYLTEIDGVFDINYPVTVEGRSEWILPTSNLAAIENSGQNYYLDDKVSVGGSSTYTQTLKAVADGAIDPRVTGVFANIEIALEVDGEAYTDFRYDGKRIYHSSILKDSEVKVTFPSYEGYVTIESLGLNGEVKSFTIYESPIGKGANAPVSINSTAGTGFVGTLTQDTLRAVAGAFPNDKGQLSSTKVIQDSDYYQDFSYVIKSSLDIDKYKDLVLKLLHPAGMKMFGQVNIIEVIKLIVRDPMDMVSIPNRSIMVDETNNELYNAYFDLDHYKFDIDPALYRIRDFKDLKIRDFIDNLGMKHLNMNDLIITIKNSSNSSFMTSVDRIDKVSNESLYQSTN